MRNYIVKQTYIFQIIHEYLELGEVSFDPPSCGTLFWLEAGFENFNRKIWLL